MRRAMGKKKGIRPSRRNVNPLYKVLSIMASKSPLQMKYLTCSFTFAGYGFNKSHSAAYAYIAYQTAYLKAHYFPEFMVLHHDEFYAKYG